MCPFKYYDFMRICKDTKYLRLKLVQFARQEGVKPAARAFGCSPKTVRKWRDRYDGSLKSLSERSRAPHNHPNRITEADERKIVRAHNRLPTWGARRLKRDLELPYSVKTIAKVRKKRGLTRKYRRKKHQTKRCLREVKKRWRFMQQIDIDTKHLYDMPEYWPLIEDLGLPSYQYTARDVTTGTLYLGYSDELSLACAEVFAEQIIERLKKCGVKLGRATWQSDNGSEFIGSWQAKDASAFTKTIESVPGQGHKTIPPGAHRFQADVETVHSLMENEFYLIEPFRDRADFIRKANEYQLYFNLARTNSGKENKTPWQLIQTKFRNPDPRIPALAVCCLDRLHYKTRLHKFNQRGYDVWVLPCWTQSVVYPPSFRARSSVWNIGRYLLGICIMSAPTEVV